MPTICGDVELRELVRQYGWQEDEISTRRLRDWRTEGIIESWGGGGRGITVRYPEGTEVDVHYLLMALRLRPKMRDAAMLAWWWGARIKDRYLRSVWKSHFNAIIGVADDFKFGGGRTRDSDEFLHNGGTIDEYRSMNTLLLGDDSNIEWIASDAIVPSLFPYVERLVEGLVVDSDVDSNTVRSDVDSNTVRSDVYSDSDSDTVDTVGGVVDSRQDTLDVLDGLRQFGKMSNAKMALNNSQNWTREKLDSLRDHMKNGSIVVDCLVQIFMDAYSWQGPQAAKISTCVHLATYTPMLAYFVELEGHTPAAG